MAFEHIQPDQLQRTLEQQPLTLIDIRDRHSYVQGTVPGALRIDNQNLAHFLAEADYERPLVVICYHGNSSQPTADYFSQQGFDQVYSLDGGFELWQRCYPTLIEQPTTR